MTGWRSGQVGFQLGTWAKQDGTGIAFSSSAGFVLPNGAIYAPYASWVPLSWWNTLSKEERDGLPNGAIYAPYASWLPRSWWDTLSKEERDGFAHRCPDFLVELRSKWDDLTIFQDKMAEYLENGTLLGWLIDFQERRVYVYRPGQPVDTLEEPDTISGHPVLPGFVLNLGKIWPSTLS
jgi:Uma2 family endonuclease